MSDHFSYLYEDDAAPFFQRAANRAVPQRSAPAAPLTKTASTATEFEKIARQLDRDIEVLRSAGPCGLRGGMMKRADRYIDQVAYRTELTAEQLGEIFDKVAAAAIQGDLDAAYAELTEGVPEGLHPIVEQTLMKIGRDLTSLALLEKGAGIGSWLGRAVTRGGAGELEAATGIGKGMLRRGASTVAEGAGSAAKAVGRVAGGAAEGVKAVGQGVGRAASRAAEGLSEGVAGAQKDFRAARQAKMISSRAATAENLNKARQIATEGGVHATRAADAVPALERKLVPQNNKDIAKAMDKSKSEWLGKEPTTTASKPAASPAVAKPAAAPAAAGEAKVIKSEGERTKAVGDAAAAAKAPPGQPKLTVHEGGKGTGTDGPAPATAPHAEHAGGEGPKPPANPPAEVKATDAFKKWSEGGWKSLSQAEKGAMIRAGVVGAAGYRAVTGKGAITGGEGLI